MSLFTKKPSHYIDPVEQTFSAMMKLIKDLSKPDYRRLKKAMDLGYESYQVVRNVKTDDERENEDIDEIEKSLEKESKR